MALGRLANSHEACIHSSARQTHFENMFLKLFFELWPRCAATLYPYELSALWCRCLVLSVSNDFPALSIRCLMLSVSGDCVPHHWKTIKHCILEPLVTIIEPLLCIIGTLLTIIKSLRTTVELLLTTTRSLLTISHPLRHLRRAVNHYWAVLNERGQSLGQYFLWPINYNCKIFPITAELLLTVLETSLTIVDNCWFSSDGHCTAKVVPSSSI